VLGDPGTGAVDVRRAPSSRRAREPVRCFNSSDRRSGAHDAVLTGVDAAIGDVGGRRTTTTSTRRADGLLDLVGLWWATRVRSWRRLSERGAQAGARGGAVLMTDPDLLLFDEAVRAGLEPSAGARPWWRCWADLARDGLASARDGHPPPRGDPPGITHALFAAPGEQVVGGRPGGRTCFRSAPVSSAFRGLRDRRTAPVGGGSPRIRD